MGVYRGCCVCRTNGEIIAVHDWESLKPESEILGTITFEWFAEHHREQAKTLFARAAIGQPLPPAVLEFNPDQLGGEFACQVEYKPTGEPMAPVLGVFSMFSRRILDLTVRERAVAKLLPTHSIREIAGQIGTTRDSVVAIKKRLAAKMVVSLAEIVPLCTMLGSVL